MGFQVALKILMWFCVAWVGLAVISGLYVFFRAVGREWIRQRALEIRKRTLRLPAFVIDPTKTKEQERGRYIAILHEHVPDMDRNEMDNALERFNRDYEDLMARRFQADLEHMSPDDFRR